MEPLDKRSDSSQPSRRVRLVQWLRWLLKATVWHGITFVFDRLGFTAATVQVLCIDRATQRLLVLRTREYACGYCPVQGLRRGALTFGLVTPRVDVREDARRELEEEAVVNPPPIQDFWVAERYREGPQRQFDCTVMLVFADQAALKLREETGEGAACWMPLPEAMRVLGNQALRDLLAKWQDDPEQGEAAERRRFMIRPAAEVHPPAWHASQPPQRYWSMPLLMLAEARALGRRDAGEIHQADPEFAAQLWDGMGTAARDCYRPDPRLWRDCRLLDGEQLAGLLAGWREARTEGLSGAEPEQDACTVPGRASPQAAVALMQRCGSEFALDLIYDSHEDRIGCFLTRGGLGGIMSDVLLFALTSPRFMVMPVFHTHPEHYSDRGYKQPSTADYWVMTSLHLQLNGAPAGDCVVTPDGSLTEYGITGHGSCFYRRTHDLLLPEGGEAAYTLTTVALPDRRRARPRSG